MPRVVIRAFYADRYGQPITLTSSSSQPFPATQEAQGSLPHSIYSSLPLARLDHIDCELCVNEKDHTNPNSWNKTNIVLAGPAHQPAGKLSLPLGLSGLKDTDWQIPFSRFKNAVSWRGSEGFPRTNCHRERLMRDGEYPVSPYKYRRN